MTGPFETYRYANYKEASIIDKIREITSSSKRNRRLLAESQIEKALELCLIKIERSANNCEDGCYFNETDLQESKLLWTVDLRELLEARLKKMGFRIYNIGIHLDISWKKETV